MVAVGFTLQPDHVFLDLLDPLLREVDYYEVAPETLWVQDQAGDYRDNDFHERALALAAETGTPFVGHGVSASLCSVSRAAREQRRALIARVARDAERFQYLWYSDHLGVSAPAGQDMVLPLPAPMDAAMERVLADALGELSPLAPRVAVENTAHYALCGSPLDEARFLNAALARADADLVLDLHNLHVSAHNLGFDPHRYLDALELQRVVEIHVSGGQPSHPDWLPGGRRVRLDSHDAAVPEAVFALLASVAPRCPRLRGVTLERMEGTVRRADVAVLRGELRRIRELLP